MDSLVERYAGRIVLGVGAHPDDLEIAMGGTIARLSEAGAHVVMAVMAVPNRIEERVAEAHAAAKVLNAKAVVVDPERCRRVEDMHSYEIVGDIDALVRTYAPDAIFSHPRDEIHHDHKLVHQAVISAMRVRQMDVYFFQPSTCKPNVQSFQPRIWIDVTATIDKKIEAIAAHRSQFGARGICVDYFRNDARARGLPVGMPYAEGLDVLCLRS